MVAEKTFEVVYIQTEEEAVLCRYQIGKSGITVTNTVNEEVALFIKWENVQAWWNSKSKTELVVNEKLEKAGEGGENGAKTERRRSESTSSSASRCPNWSTAWQTVCLPF